MPIILLALILIWLFLLYFLSGRQRLSSIIQLILRATGLLLVILTILFVCRSDIVGLLGNKAQLRSWNTFHYYLGSKYFNELGYFNLYTCAFAADQSGRKLFNEQAMVRDLRTYKITTADKLPSCPSGNFTPERWQEFKNDLLFLQQESPIFSQSVITDKGYNPTLFWTTIASFLANRIDFREPLTAKFWFNIDILLILISLLLLCWAFGLETAIVATLFIFLYFGTYQRLWGNFLQYGWFLGIIGGICFWQKRWIGFSAFCWVVAGLLRLFPFLLLSSLAIKTIYFIFKQKKISLKQPVIQFFAYLILYTVLLLVLTYTLNPSKVQWIEYYYKMKTHSSFINGELFNIGLKNLIITLTDPNPYPAVNYAQEYINVINRMNYFENVKTVYYFLSSLMLLIFFVYLTVFSITVNQENKGNEKEQINIFALSIPVVYLLLTLSPYYYLSLVLFLLPMAQSSDLKRFIFQGLLFLLLLIHHFLFRGHYISPLNETAHLISEILISLYLVIVVVWSDLKCSSLTPFDTD